MIENFNARFYIYKINFISPKNCFLNMAQEKLNFKSKKCATAGHDKISNEKRKKKKEKNFLICFGCR